MKAFKKILSCILVLSLCFTALFSLATTATAYDSTNADYLYEHNLFKGSNKGYELDRSASRAEAAVMLIRLLGREDEGATMYASGKTNCPFSDVPRWAQASVSWLAENGYVKGVSETEYGSVGIVSAQQFATLILRALGYTEANGDFTYADAMRAAVRMKLISEAESASMQNSFLRGDMVTMCFNALALTMSGSDKTLYQKLDSEGIFATKPTAPTTEPSEGSTPENTETGGGEPVTYARISLAGVTADVVKVDVDSSRVKIRSAMVNNTLGATAPFSQIVSDSGADVLINANFFESYEAFKKPIGHFMSDGVLRYGVTGLPGIGITSDKKVTVGNPAYFFKVSSSGSEWSIYECNSTSQAPDGSVIYNSSYGNSMTVTYAGTVMTIENGSIKAVAEYADGAVLPIPANGYLVWMSYGFTGTNYYKTPVVGSGATVTPYLYKADSEGYTGSGVVTLVSGAPRLVKDGAADYSENVGFTEARFTSAVTPRTALGVSWSGDLVLVSTGAASIQQMRELMVSLGCEDAINLDGGASTAMYCNGSYIRSPGRELTTTLQVFVD